MLVSMPAQRFVHNAGENAPCLPLKEAGKAEERTTLLNAREGGREGNRIVQLGEQLGDTPVKSHRALAPSVCPTETSKSKVF